MVRESQLLMERRQFLRLAALTAPALTLPRVLRADQSCSEPQNTPNGPVVRCTAGIRTFRFQSSPQLQANWCWAACISMIFAFYGYSVQQATIVSEIFGAAVDRPGQPSQILAELNKNWTDDRGKRFRAQGDAVSANNFTAVRDLQANQPLIVGSHGHAMVLTALTADTNTQTGQFQFIDAIVRDPMVGQRSLNVQEWNNISFAARVRVAS